MKIFVYIAVSGVIKWFLPKKYVCFYLTQFVIIILAFDQFQVKCNSVIYYEIGKLYDFYSWWLFPHEKQNKILLLKLNIYNFNWTYY